MGFNSSFKGLSVSEGVPKFSYNIFSTSGFFTPEGQHVENPILKTHKYYKPQYSI